MADRSAPTLSAEVEAIVIVREPHEPLQLGDLEERLLARFSPPLRPEAVQQCLAEIASSYQDARVRTYLPILIERAAVDRLRASARRGTSQIHLVSQGGAS